MPKGIMLTPEQQAERREEIIGVALRLIEKNGFQKTSMREIAVLANMGKSSLYDFFKTKDEIVVYAVEKKIEETIQKVHRIIADESSPEQCLRKIMLNHLGVPKQYRTVLMARLLINSVIAIIYTSRPSASPEKMLDETMNIFLHGIMNDGGELL